MNCARAKIVIRGAVQGVGFRPFVYRLATGLRLAGWVLNSSQGLFIEVEGEKEFLEEFLLRLERERPPRSVVQSLETTFLDPVGYKRFEIRESDVHGPKTALILPDIATCAECLREIFDPQDRRYLYPFTNCTNCGPRFSILERLPYDRPNTSMRKFAMCPECEREYHDPRDRRFHAQPNACVKCGPHLELWDESGRILAKHEEALLRAAAMIRGGRVVALKGVGGFQLLVDARYQEAVLRLRTRKRREEKPFALMYPSVAAIECDCRVSPLEARLLQASESPIVLLEKQAGVKRPTAAVAPCNLCFGAMLPYSPVHHLLLRELDCPVVATSGNLTDEPICIDEHEALERLQGVADAFLVHDRPIVRPVDDSVVRVMLGREMVLRRARGYAPLPLHVKGALPNILAVGAHLKNTVALGIGSEIFVSQHIGDLGTKEAYGAFRKTVGDLQQMYEVAPQTTVCDMHPDYLSSKFAKQSPAALVRVQHHCAHVLACMAENELEPPVLGVAWDGTGYGPDGTVWGGEFLVPDEASFKRVGHLRTFRLPGGEACSKQPRRSALGVLYELLGDDAFDRHDLIPVRQFSERELQLLRQALKSQVNAPATSSVGRLFDGVVSLTGLRQQASFEGQAAMELEFAVNAIVDEAYPFELSRDPPYIVDWQPMIREVLDDMQAGVAIGVIAARFHNALAEVVVSIARQVGHEAVVLTGGCFQNKYLTEQTVRRLREGNFRAYWHQRVPPNDGGIAPGQVIAAWRAARMKANEVSAI